MTMFAEEVFGWHRAERNRTRLLEDVVDVSAALDKLAVPPPLHTQATALVRNEIALVARAVQECALAQTILLIVLEQTIVAAARRQMTGGAPVELAVHPTAALTRVGVMRQQCDARHAVRGVKARALPREPVRLATLVERPDVIRAEQRAERPGRRRTPRAIGEQRRLVGVIALGFQDCTTGAQRTSSRIRNGLPLARQCRTATANAAEQTDLQR